MYKYLHLDRSEKRLDALRIGIKDICRVFRKMPNQFLLTTPNDLCFPVEAHTGFQCVTGDGFEYIGKHHETISNFSIARVKSGIDLKSITDMQLSEILLSDSEWKVSPNLYDIIDMFYMSHDDDYIMTSFIKDIDEFMANYFFSLIDVPKNDPAIGEVLNYIERGVAYRGDQVIELPIKGRYIVEMYDEIEEFSGENK